MRNAVIALAVLVLLTPAAAGAQTTKLRVAICARTIMGSARPSRWP
jgi:hypothetical protein